MQALIERWKPVATVIETNSAGQAFLEEMKRRLPKARLRGITTANQSKAELVNAFALACEREEVGLLADPVLLAELQSFEATQLPSGLNRYAAPAGQHDDCVMAVLLAWSAGQYSGPV